MYQETLTGRPHDTLVQKLPVTMKMWIQFNVMLGTDNDMPGYDIRSKFNT